MHGCVSVYVYVYMGACLCVCVCMDACVCACVHSCVCACVVVGEVSMYVCGLWVPKCMSNCACVCVDTRGYVRCSVYYSTLHSFETGSPAAPGARSMANNPLSFSCLYSTQPPCLDAVLGLHVQV